VGEVLDCGVDSGMDASIDVAAMDAPIDVTTDAPLMIVNNISCGHVAISNQYGELPATVCLLMPDSSVNCAKAVPNVSSDIGGPPAGLSANCISGGEDFFCAVTSAGGVMCWGDGTAFDPALDAEPAFGNATEVLNIPGLSSGVVDIAAGETHVCVLMANGAVMCWGNRAAEANTGTWALPTAPTMVSGFDGTSSRAVAIASGDGFSCALRSDGAVLCWGNNGTGELGNRTMIDSQTPVLVQGLPSRAVGIWADAATSPCALLEDGTVWCWGMIIEDPGHAAIQPVQVTGFAAGVTALTTGGEVDESCALLTTGGVQCWGTAFNDNIGNGTPSSAVPVDILPSGSGAIELRSNDTNFCALLSGGGVTCWGDTSGLATGSTGAPAIVAGL
jgi:alpha-tubulin suppressor-like RCC1 family protein